MKENERRNKKRKKIVDWKKKEFKKERMKETKKEWI